MEEGLLWSYVEGEPVSEEAIYAYAATLPLLVKYLTEEFTSAHVEKHRSEAALGDLRQRLRELIDEARWNCAIGRPLTVATWYVSKRDFTLARPSEDLRRRRARIREQEQPLFAQYEDLHQRLKKFLPRRTDHAPISAEAFRDLKRAFPDIPWESRTESIGETPATVARRILSKRLGVTPKGVEKAVRRSRRQWRQEAPPSSK